MLSIKTTRSNVHLTTVELLEFFARLPRSQNFQILALPVALTLQHLLYVPCPPFPIVPPSAQFSSAIILLIAQQQISSNNNNSSQMLFIIPHEMFQNTIQLQCQNLYITRKNLIYTVTLHCAATLILTNKTFSNFKAKGSIPCTHCQFFVSGY